MTNEFTCAHCHKTFERAWTTEEAIAEMEANGWSGMDKEHMDEVCDACYEMFIRDSTGVTIH